MKKTLLTSLLVMSSLLPICALSDDSCPPPFTMPGVHPIIWRFEGHNLYKLHFEPLTIILGNQRWKIQQGQDDGDGIYIYSTKDWDPLEAELPKIFAAATFFTRNGTGASGCNIGIVGKEPFTEGDVSFIADLQGKRP